LPANLFFALSSATPRAFITVLAEQSQNEFPEQVRLLDLAALEAQWRQAD